MPSTTSTRWSVEYDTIRRQKLFSRPPTDHTAYPALAQTIKPHVDSFNAIFEESKILNAGLRDIGTYNVTDADITGLDHQAESKNLLSLRVREVTLERPVLPTSNKFTTTNRNIFPSECRERHASYRGKLRARLEYRVNNGPWKESIRELGLMPIMLRSNRCHLENLTPHQLVQKKEETEELGGYFIVNGNEKLIRLLVMPKRNYPMAISRNAFSNRGPGFTNFGVQIRSVRPDQTSQTNVLHYLSDGNVTFRFSWRKSEYLVPVVMILKALIETNDREIFENLVGSASSKGASNTFVTDRVELLLRTYKAYSLYGRAKTRSYLGEKFQPVLGVPSTMPYEQVGAEFLRRIVLPHLGNQDVTDHQNRDKFNLLLFMIRKLYTVAAGDCAVDNADAVANQEVLLGGFLYGMILKEKIQEYLSAIGAQARQWCMQRHGLRFTDSSFDKDFIPRMVRRTNENIGQLLEYFLSTGNLSSSSGLDLQQTSGFTVVAEKINFYRFISHFRMIHRGSFFAQLKTTTVRKLLPESWGFLCPVHTPDGAPCGLLNHLAHQCRVQVKPVDVSKAESAIRRLGLTSSPSVAMEESVSVQLDGRILGYCMPSHARILAHTLRFWKVNGENGIPVELEIGYVPNSNGGQFPGLYIFSQPARMLRPVNFLPLEKPDLVGPFEQPYMEIACVPEDIISGVTTHIEFEPTNILSILANMTPFSNFNQSPRNMYQCQMSKQAMGTPGAAMEYRTDNKAYRLQTGQTPIARPPMYNDYGLDNYPNGVNAIVAVISYTGYDMDDAMIINKSSHERGFGDGTIFKTKVYALEESGRARSSKTDIKKLFGFAPTGALEGRWRDHLDEDGLPYIGNKVREGDIVAAFHSVMFDPEKNRYVNLDGRTQFLKYKEFEDAYIDQVRLLGSETGIEPCQTISIKYRVPRKPVIGDKFSSRHGQKGVCSQLWPAIDMPFSESGIQPDVIINPHAFPSRMTIGMFIESLAGKAGALHGLAQDSTPFRFTEDYTAADHFGHQLLQAGYNFQGNEPMYSGITGQEFAADIYLGVVFYQRLRHMVNDKFQVRTTGPVNQQTGQPVKGRAKGGGIRVGEMERDSLLAHGTAYLLQDRLMNCSDEQKAWICKACGSFLSTQSTVTGFTMNRVGRGGARGLQPTSIVRCRACAREARYEDLKSSVWEDGQGRKYVGGEDTTVVTVPGVLRYLDAELCAIGIKMKFGISP
ncbi:MAG: hypothetical protein Q9227_002342 [Pyrenula ochraceoflavens]